MYIFEFVVPGTWLDYEDRDWSWKVGGLLDNLQSQFFEANLALNLFSSSQQARTLPGLNREKWERYAQLRSEIQQAVELESGGMNFHENWEEIRFETDVCSGLMIPDTYLGENARHIEVSDDQTTPCVFR